MKFLQVSKKNLPRIIQNGLANRVFDIAQLVKNPFISENIDQL